MNEVIEFYEVLIKEKMFKIKEIREEFENIEKNEKDVIVRMSKLNRLDNQLIENEIRLEKLLNIRYLANCGSKSHE